MKSLSFYINGKEVSAPVEWPDIEVSAAFLNDSVQPTISADSFVFVYEARQEILNHIAEGLGGGVGIFEGVPFRIVANTSSQSFEVFDGFLDLATDLKDQPQSGRLEVQIKKQSGLDSIEQQLSAITAETLYQSGQITDSDFIDVPYVVVQPTSLIEVATLGIASYLLAQSLQEQIEKVSKDAANLVAHTGGGVTGPVAGVVFAAAILIIDIAFAIAVIAAISKLLIQIINSLLPIKRTHKGIYLKTLLEKAVASLGYGFESDIEELDNLVYLPSNLNYDVEDNLSGFISQYKSIQEGIPNSRDYGYLMLEVIQLFKDLFNAKFAVDGNNTLQVRSENSEYWQTQSSYVLPDVLIDTLEFNTGDLKSSFIVSFDTDLSDDWTISNYSGTVYQRITDAVSVSDARNKSISGVEEVNINVCLGSRKGSLNALENLLLGYAKVADAFINLLYITAELPIRSNYAAQIKGKVDLLKVATNNHSKPKLLYLNESGIQPANHRELFSAKTLYQKYWVEKSFVAGNWNGQKRLYRGIRIPFGLPDWLKLLENSYIATTDGSQAKIEQIDWNLGGDFAVIDFWVKEPYTFNLSETFIG